MCGQVLDCFPVEVGRDTPNLNTSENTVLNPGLPPLNPQPSTLEPSTLNPQPSTLNPETLNPQSSTLNHQVRDFFPVEVGRDTVDFVVVCELEEVVCELTLWCASRCGSSSRRRWGATRSRLDKLTLGSLASTN